MLKQVLTIAGSDSGAGAGIQADLKTFHANGVYGLSVITSVTAQNTREVRAAFDLPEPVIQEQLDAIFSDFDVAATKTGMLSSSTIVDVVARRLLHYNVRDLVVDPVMISKSGFPLLKPEAIESIKRHLLPLATVVTPNVYEAELLSGIEIKTVEEATRAAQAIARYGPRSVIVKGGHLPDGPATDVFFDGHDVVLFEGERIETKNTHGTGCTFSAAIAAHLALGKEWIEAIRCAKEYTTEAIRHGLDIGRGHGPTDHFYFLREREKS